MLARRAIAALVTRSSESADDADRARDAKEWAAEDGTGDGSVAAVIGGGGGCMCMH